MTPQMTDGAAPSELLTLKVSVRHWVACVEAVPAPVCTGAPFRVLVVDTVEVEGPVSTKVLKSKRS